MKRRIFLIISAVILIITAVFAILWTNGIFKLNPKPLKFYGNVDDRQLDLSFNLTERIESINVDEGALIKKGDLLGSLESIRIKHDLASAQAGLAGAEAHLQKLKKGPRSEDIEIARAAFAAAQAKLKADANEFERQKMLKTTAAVSLQSLEKAEANYYLALAGVSAAKSNLEKNLAGSRAEDIAEAEAKVAQMTAQLEIKKQMLLDTKLYAPCDGIIRNRLLHPGEMTSPQTPVLVLAVISPKWVRIYLPEYLLLKVKSGDAAAIYFDGNPQVKLDGFLGFVSPVSEFTPKNVETPELRTSLVYEARVMVNDPENQLKLGAPATVIFPGVTAK